MSRVSLFKFNFNGNEQILSIIKQIIDNYLNSRGFFYNGEKSCYITGRLTKRLKSVKSIFWHADKIKYGFEYQISGNELIIKAHTIDWLVDRKRCIHLMLNKFDVGRYFYSDLKN